MKSWKKISLWLNILCVMGTLLVLQTRSFAEGMPPKGVYHFGDGSFVVFVEMNKQPCVIFPDGNIRGLKPASAINTFKYGTAIAMFETIEGEVTFDEKGETVMLKTAAGEKIAKRLALKEEEKKFKSDRITLSGTLILPEGKGPFACVVMTHGSGPESREGNRGLAYLFAGNGIAAFIYDKREVTPVPDSNWREFLLSDYASDAIAAAQLMKKQKEIDDKKIGVFGHSQGGWVVPIAAMHSKLFSFAIISAGNAVTPVEQHLYRGSCFSRQMGMREEFIKEMYEFRLTKYEAGITGNRANFEAALPIAKQKPWFQRTGDGIPGGRFWINNGYYDPDTALRAMKCPVLVMGGEFDRYSDTKRNMALFEQSFKKGGNGNVTYKILPSANHAYLETTTGKMDETELPQLKRFVPGYFELLTGWVKKTCEAL